MPEPRHTLVVRAEGTITQLTEMLAGMAEQLDGLGADESFGLDRSGRGFSLQVDVQPAVPEEEALTDG